MARLDLKDLFSLAVQPQERRPQMKRLSLLLTCVAALACASTASAADPLRVVDGIGSFAGGANIFDLSAVGPATPDPNNPAFGTLEIFSAPDSGAHYIHGSLTCLTVKP